MHGSTDQSSGWAAMNLSIRARHSALSRTTTSTPRDFCSPHHQSQTEAGELQTRDKWELRTRYASPPRKVLFSPITTRDMP